jgi:hypothetical protein
MICCIRKVHIAITVAFRIVLGDYKFRERYRFRETLFPLTLE